MGRSPRAIRIDGDVAYVPLTKGYEAVIDAADVALVDGRCWTAAEDGHTVYAYRKSMLEKPKHERMHRLIVGASCGFDVDHIDGNGLNNRRSNLRVVTAAQNQWNSRKSGRNPSDERGVRWKKNRWEVSLAQGGRSVYLGRFATKEAAVHAYKTACAAVRGEFARLA